MHFNPVYIICVIVVLCLVVFFIQLLRKRSQRNRVNQIQLGMSEEHMLTIMRGKYNKSYLKNNRTKYEWRFSNAHSYGNSSHGFSSRTYTGVRKVTIYCKDGFVEEVKPYNLY